MCVRACVRERKNEWMWACLCVHMCVCVGVRAWVCARVCVKKDDFSSTCQSRISWLQREKAKDRLNCVGHWNQADRFSTVSSSFAE